MRQDRSVSLDTSFWFHLVRLCVHTLSLLQFGTYRSGPDSPLCWELRYRTESRTSYLRKFARSLHPTQCALMTAARNGCVDEWVIGEELYNVHCLRMQDQVRIGVRTALAPRHEFARATTKKRALNAKFWTADRVRLPSSQYE